MSIFCQRIRIRIRLGLSCGHLASNSVLKEIHALAIFRDSNNLTSNYLRLRERLKQL